MKLRLLAILSLTIFAAIFARAEVVLVAAVPASGSISPDGGSPSSGIYRATTEVPITGAITTVSPTASYAIYKLDVATNSTAIAIDTSALDLDGQYATFEMEVLVSDADFSFTIPGTNDVTYLGGLPDITTTVDGTRHFFTFRAMATNDVVCNLWWTRTP